MEVPSILQGPHSCVSWRGCRRCRDDDRWLQLGRKVAKAQADAAVVTALAPICVVDKFRQAANAQANLTELNKINYDWDRSTFVEKGAWATMPGAVSPDTAVAQARVLGKS